MAASRIQGIFVPNMIPFDKDGKVNEPELRRYVNWLIEQRRHGLYPNGTTGEFIRLTLEERRRVIAVIVEEVPGASQSSPGRPIRRPRDAQGLRVLRQPRRAIVRGRGSLYFKMSPDNVYAYFKEICDNSPLDITLYNIPVFASMITLPRCSDCRKSAPEPSPSRIRRATFRTCSG